MHVHVPGTPRSTASPTAEVTSCCPLPGTGALTVTMLLPSCDSATAHTPYVCGCASVLAGCPVLVFHSTTSGSGPVSAVTSSVRSSVAAMQLMALQWPCAPGDRGLMLSILHGSH